MPWLAVHPDIAEFMRRPQVGARRVAKTILATAHSLRTGQFAAALSDEADPVQDEVFVQLPTDRGHFSVPLWVPKTSVLRHDLRWRRRPRGRQPPAGSPS